jgi:cold shock CspA family protein
VTTGTVVRLMTESRYGFLRDDHAPDAPDVFFHASDCERRFDDLHVGQRVEFIFGSNRRTGRPLARHVRPLDATSPR